MKKGKEILATTIVAGAMLMQGSVSSAQTSSPDRQIASEEIRPFKIHFDDAQLADLRKIILATRWPEKEAVTDHSQGVQLETMKALARYWATDYDWREIEIKLNSLPQFITAID